MTKNPTDNQLQKILAELAEHVPEIDPTDDEWRIFLKNFIAARPDEKIDEKFQQELRSELLVRAAQLSRPIVHPRSHEKLWWKFGLTFAGGAAVCAAVVVPMLTHTPTEVATPRTVKMITHDTEILSKTAHPFVESKRNIDEVSPKNEEIVPTFIQHTAPPILDVLPATQSTSPSSTLIETKPIINLKKTINKIIPPEPNTTTEQLFYSDTRTTDEDIPASSSPELPITDSPSFDQKTSCAAMSSLAPLLWEDAPSDTQLIAIAQKFLEKTEIDQRYFEAPFVEKIWEINDQPRPLYAPEQLTVVFSPIKNTSILGTRVIIDLRTQTVENIIPQTKTNTP